jgi:hypothetical protein
MSSTADTPASAAPAASIDGAAPPRSGGGSPVLQQVIAAAATLGATGLLAVLRLGAGGPEAAALQPVLGALVLGGATLAVAAVAVLGQRRTRALHQAAAQLGRRRGAEGWRSGDAALDALLASVELRVHEERQAAAALEAKARSFSRRIDELEAEADLSSLQRRERVAAISGRITVAVAVAGRPMPGKLIDLSAAHLVIDVPTSEQPDLAPGMRARVGLAMRGMAEPGLFDVRCLSVRGASEESVRLRLSFAEPIRAEDLPLPLRELVNQRRSPRVQPRAAAGVTAGVRRQPDGRPISAEVVDMSETGVRLLLPIEQDRFSAWGTRLHLALSLGGEAPLFFIGRVRNVQADGDRQVLVGLEFDGASTPEFSGRQQALSEWICEELGEQKQQQQQQQAVAAP